VKNIWDESLLVEEGPRARATTRQCATYARQRL